MEMERVSSGIAPSFFKFTQSPAQGYSARSSSEGQQETTTFNGLDSILDDDDDYELTFSLDVQQRAAAEALAQSRRALRSEEYRQLFHLPPDEVLIQDFNCAYQKRILLQGHMYLFEHYICFYSNIFGYEKRKVIILKDVTSVRKAKTAGLFPNAIEIAAWGKKSFFASFLSRDEAYRLIVEGWARNSRNAIVDTDCQSNHSVLTSTNIITTQEEHDTCVSEASFGSRDIVEVHPSFDGEVENSAEHSDAQVAEVSSCGEELSHSEESKNDIPAPEGDTFIEHTPWEVGDEDAPKVSDAYKAILEYEMPVDVKDFFQIFFSDSSIKFFESFHNKCGDQEFQCTKWSKAQHYGGHVRDVSFRHPVKVYFGPKSSTCQEVQRYRVYRNSHLVIETSQQMNDIPYGDYFHVEGRWDVVPVSGKQSPHCAVHIYVNVAFSKKTVWKGKIEQGTYDECKEVFSVWLSEALKLLQEKGLMDSGPTKFENPVQTVLTTAEDNVSAPLENRVKRKLEVDYNPSQNSKVPKTGQSRVVVKSKPNTQKPDLPSRSSEELNKPLSIAQIISIDQNKLVFIMLALLVLFLIQTGVIIGLLRSTTKVQYIPINLSRSRDYMGPPYGNLDTSLTEHSLRLLREEILITESRLENMRFSLEILKSSLKLAPNSEEASSPG